MENTLTTTLIAVVLVGFQVQAQYRTPLIPNYLTLEEAIQIAHTSSPTAQMAELNFMSRYWSFRSFRAELLPAVNLNGSLGNYNHSVVEARDPETGEINYVSNNTLNNRLTLSVDQKIALTGGTVSVESSLSRLDQFTYDYVTYNSEPVSIRYVQPLRAFNSLKWQKKTAPLEYEQAKRNYLQSMEQITLQTTHYFFAVLSAQTALDNAKKNFEDSQRMYEISKKRFDIASITKSDLLQLELSKLNAELAIRDNQVAVEVAKFNLKFHLGMMNAAPVELLPPSAIPNISMEYDFVLERALENSTHKLDQSLTQLASEKALAQAKAARGIQMQLNANLGLSQTGPDLSSVYSALIDREVVGLSVSMPIFDWGLSKGRVKMAEAQLDMVKTEIAQKEIQFRQDIMIKVLEFNNQIAQCRVSDQAKSIAQERYEIMVHRFENGGVSVENLNTAQDEMKAATHKYISQLQAFWSAYYEIQKIALYDFVKKEDLKVVFDNLIERQL